jgi:hypothetical protein
LEREWNDKLKEMELAGQQYAEARRQHKVDLSDAERSRILNLARDLPRVWNASSTTSAERKNLLRMLVREITLSPVSQPKRATRVQVLWQTGAVTNIIVPRPSQFTASVTDPIAVTLIAKLIAKGKSDIEIASELNSKRIPTGKDRPWNQQAVRWVRFRHKLRRPALSMCFPAGFCQQARG